MLSAYIALFSLKNAVALYSRSFHLLSNKNFTGIPEFPLTLGGILGYTDYKAVGGVGSPRQANRRQ